MSEFELLECGNTAWAFARCTIRDRGLFDCLFARIFERPEEVDFQAVHAICCATWAVSEGHLPWELLEGRARHGLALDATSHGFLLMHGNWSGHQEREVQVLTALASCIGVEVLRPTIARGVTIKAIFDSVFEPRPGLLRSPNDDHAWYRYQKLGLLVHFVEATALKGSPQSLLSCIEGFVQDGHRRWLKIAGGPKALVIDAATSTRPLSAHEIGIEMGCFVGYTAIRLGWRLGGQGFWGASMRTGVLSTELEAVHVCIARHHIDGARMSCAAEVWPGHIPWVTPRYVEQFGMSGAGFIFMDHKGTRFHDDLGDCSALRILAPRSRLLCDNVLKPGAPSHLWIHHRAPVCHRSAVVWSLHEFLEPECEDWQSLRDEPPQKEP